MAPPLDCLMTAPGSLRRSGSGSALGSLFRGSFDEVHCRCDRTVQSESCFRVQPRGFFPDSAFGREQSNSTGGTHTRVATSFTGAHPKNEVEKGAHLSAEQAGAPRVLLFAPSRKALRARKSSASSGALHTRSGWTRGASSDTRGGCTPQFRNSGLIALRFPALMQVSVRIQFERPREKDLVGAVIENSHPDLQILQHHAIHEAQLLR